LIFIKGSLEKPEEKEFNPGKSTIIIIRQRIAQKIPKIILIFFIMNSQIKRLKTLFSTVIIEPDEKIAIKRKETKRKIFLEKFFIFPAGIPLIP
jgi:hypothetical protein